MTEHEELLVLRALAEKQQQELARKDQTIEAQKAQIEKQRIQIENMIQALLHARKKLFGRSTEVSKDVDGQLSLFHTAQKLEEYIIPETDACSQCGSKLKIVGKRIVRTEVEFVPAKLKVKQIVQQVAKCTRCGTDESEYDSCHFQKASVPAPPLAHSISTPSLIAQVMYQKFVMGMPFARQEKDWYRLGLWLTRADMANWSIRCCEEWLLPIYERIHEQLLECQVLHKDETRIQCNKETGKKAGSCCLDLTAI